MDSPKVERGSCRFKTIIGADGKPVIHLELFHNSVKILAGISIEFELLSGSTMEQAKSLTDAANDRILGVIVSKS
jgi:hypothetical protein